MKRLTIAIVFAFIAILALSIEALPLDPKPKDTKESAVASKEVKEAIVKAAKEAKKNKKDCGIECSANYNPVCAFDPADCTFKPRTFGNQCVLDRHNCEMGTKLVIKNEGECPGAAGVRLF